MQKKALYTLIFLFLGFLSYAQECPSLTFPMDGATNVSVNTTITWEAVDGVPGYLISIGTTPGGTDIVDRQSTGSATSYTPPLGLPDDSQLYVTITLFFFNLPNITCPSETFRTEDVTTTPPCTILRSPLNGATNVNIASNISWEYAPTATSYVLSYGTIPGGGDLFTGNVGNTLSFNPPFDFPPNTEIFVSISPENENGARGLCVEESFTTGAIAALPSCATLLNPLNGATNVPLNPLLQWTPVGGAAGYRVSIGTSPFNNDILDEAVFTVTETAVIAFEPNRTFFVSIIAFNATGNAIGCTQEFFSTILGCASFFDPATGELVASNPQISFPDEVGICENEIPTTVTSTDIADGFRWYQVNADGTETLLSETDEVAISERGDYRYEAFNIIDQNGDTFECATTKPFIVGSSEIANISRVNLSGQSNGVRLEVIATGIGDYEYALNDINGPYQDSNIFENVPMGSYTVFVRDKKGCGIAERSVEQDLTLDGFPKFFTPNGDGINDFWQFIPPSMMPNTIALESILIFDRYGTFLAQIDPNTQGWDGTFNGQELPASDYWFKALDNNNQEIRGHFALKR